MTCRNGLWLWTALWTGAILSIHSSAPRAALPIIDDSDLFPPPAIPRVFADRVFRPDRIVVEGAVTDRPKIRLTHKTENGTFTTESLTFSAGRHEKEGHCHFRAPLSHRFYTIAAGSNAAPYEIQFEAPCRESIEITFDAGSPGAEAAEIWRIAQTAIFKLETSVGLGFWDRPLRFVWPSDGDYYWFRQVNITRGDHWDVVGHELGHAIYDIAGLGQSRGGQHRIDECYHPTLALSEGWASYFSAWLSVDLRDPDARFQYMVPRRAPIRFENIPADVCRGEANEWRVTGFFWDLIDLNDDHEPAGYGFATLWRALENTRVADVAAAISRLERAGVSKAQIQLVRELNFQ